MRTHINLKAVLTLAFLAAMALQPANAISCGDKYEVKPGDTLSQIAKNAYRDGDKWSAIYYANQSIIGKNSKHIRPGQKLKIPCIDDTTVTTSPASTTVATSPASTTVTIRPAKASESNSEASASSEVSASNNATASTVAQVAVGPTHIRFLTADDYRPFTDRSLPKGGMITDIISSSLTTEQTQHNGSAFQIAWINDWSAHLNPLLVNQAFDMGFPWFKPPCDKYSELDVSAKFRCDKLLFSKPVFEILVLFFAKKGSDFQFKSDADVAGKRLCRPGGYFTFDLDKDGRNWVKDNKVALLRPQNTEECFQLLDQGEVDAVVLNEFTGRAAMKKIGLADKVRVIEKPVSLLGLHVVIAKSNPKAQQYLDLVNTALGRLRKSGQYNKIIDKHLSRFWESQESS